MGGNCKSDFLFAQPTFLSGAARLLDLGGRLDEYNNSDDADTRALAADWYVLGGDFEKVLQQAADELFATAAQAISRATGNFQQAMDELLATAE